MSDEAQRITRKEAARIARKAAYQQAKERRKTDPKFIAFQAKQKARRKEMNEVQKVRRKEAKHTRQEADASRREAERVEQARSMLRLVSG